jgi:hypothetical protein
MTKFRAKKEMVSVLTPSGLSYVFSSEGTTIVLNDGDSEFLRKDNRLEEIAEGKKKVSKTKKVSRKKSR